MDNVVIVLVLITSIVCFSSIAFVKGIERGFNTIRSTESVVESVDLEKAKTNTGLVVENKGFNVGDTLVIIKK